MATRLCLPTDRLADEDLGRGFEFHVRQPNKDGQFSGPVQKSIVPGAHSPNTNSTTADGRARAGCAPFDFAALARLRMPAQSDSPEQSIPAAAAREDRANQQLEECVPESSYIARETQERTQSKPPSSPFHHPVQIREPVSDSGSGAQDMRTTTDGQTKTNPIPPKTQGSIRSPRLAVGDEEEAARTTVSRVKSRRIQTPRKLPTIPRSQSQHCGDLEGYGTYAASAATRTPPSHERFMRESRSRRGSSHFGSPATRRTHSRGSNVSRKRSSAAVDPLSGERDRKRFAMSQAVELWNECMQISTKESAQATSTIDRLSKELQMREKELRNTKMALQSGGTSFNMLQQKYKDLKSKDHETTESNNELKLKYQKLLTDHENLRNHVESVSAKANSYENRLRTAVSEQQELRTETRNSFTNYDEQMRRRAFQDKADNKEVQMALESSRVMRDEMKSTVRQIQAAAEKQKIDHEHKIAMLQKESELHRSQIESKARENELIQQEMTAHMLVKDLLKGIEERVARVYPQLRTMDRGQDTIAIELRDIGLKLDALPYAELFGRLQEQMQSSHTKTDRLEALVTNCLLPTVEALVAGQGDLNANVASLVNRVESGLGGVSEQIAIGAAEVGQIIAMKKDDSQNEIIEILRTLQSGQTDVSSRMESVNVRCENLADLLSADDAISTRVTEILDSLGLLNNKGEKILAAQESAQAAMQETQKTMEEHVMQQIDNHHKASMELNASSKQYLTDTLSKFQDDVIKKWRISGSKPVGTRDAQELRSELGQAQSRLSAIEAAASSLETICNTTLILQETSKYIEREGHWTANQLRIDPSTPPGVNELSIEDPFVDEADGEKSNGPFAGNDEDVDSNLVQNQPRQVTVYSPKPDDSVAKQITAAEEQQRRRETGKPKSILKGSQEQTKTTSRAAASAHSPNETIAQIQSSFIETPPPPKKICGFTTLTQYIKSSKASTQQTDGNEIGDLTSFRHKSSCEVKVDEVA